MYYNPNSVFGPRCRNARNVSMTPDLANKLVDVSNAVRSKIARGEEKGKHGEHLPRGYGIFRLRWDAELATLAQVLANQCVLRHDLCRATKRFPDPGQTAGLVRFSIPDWYPISKSGPFNSTGLTDEKLMYSAIQSLKSWYGSKSAVTVQMLTNYPDWSLDPMHTNGRLYLEMIYGPATHMGCGISAYTEYAFYDNNAALNYNSVQIMCNFSARPRKGGAVFNTVPPTDTETTFNTCGCPAGSVEDDDCLCNEEPKESEPQNQQPFHKPRKCPNGEICDPTVVLLPIFTVEDAPPEKLRALDRFANTSHHLERNRVIDSFEDLIENNHSENRRSFFDSPSAHSKFGINGQKNRPVLSQSRHSTSVRNRQFNKPNELKHYEAQDHKQVLNHIQKPSLFVKTPKFELPEAHDFISSNKRNVLPRKDFSTGKKLAGKYLFGKKNMILTREEHEFPHGFENTITDLNEPKSVETVHLNNDLDPYLYLNRNQNKNAHHDDVHFHDILTTETVLNTAEQNVINLNNNMDDISNTTHDYDKHLNPVAEDNDNKLIALLDKLEREIKHVELHDKEKELFDAKLKKIYGQVVGKPSKLVIKDSTDLGVELNEYVKDIEDDDVTRIKDHGYRYDDDKLVHKLDPPHDKLPDNYEKNGVNHLNYRSRTHNTGTDYNDIEMDTYDKIPMSRNRKENINFDNIDKPAMRRNRNSIRQRHHNEINSLEYLRNQYDNGFKGRRAFKSNFGRNMLRNDDDKIGRRSNTIDYRLGSRNIYNNDGWNDDLLSAERKKYYQDKINSMKTKLQEARRYSRKKDSGRHMRAMRPSVRSDNQMDPLYSQGRARFLHGY